MRAFGDVEVWGADFERLRGVEVGGNGAEDGVWEVAVGPGLLGRGEDEFDFVGVASEGEGLKFEAAMRS